jgi:hypothetical protein
VNEGSAIEAQTDRIRSAGIITNNFPNQGTSCKTRSDSPE